MPVTLNLPRVSGLLVLLITLLPLQYGLAAVAPPPNGIPATISESEGPFAGSWVWNGSGYNAEWSNGAFATLSIVSFTTASVVIDRTDTAQSVSAGLTAVYTGTISSAGDSIVNGSVTWTWPGVAGYPNTGTWNASWTVSAPQSDCSKLVTFDRSKLIIHRDGIGYFTNLQDYDGIPSIRISAGRETILPIINNAPVGIKVVAGDTLINGPDVDPSDLPQVRVVQNLTGWSGDATYRYPDEEDEIDRSVHEWNAIIYPPQPEPLQLDDPPIDVPGSIFYPNAELTDSPSISVPLHDGLGRRLHRVHYRKDFKIFIGCTLPSHPTFHPIEVLPWHADYDGYMTYGFFGPRFHGDLWFPATAHAPVSAIGAKVNLSDMGSSCFTQYIDFNGTPTSCTN
jgi:hypothetical protein